MMRTYCKSLHPADYGPLKGYADRFRALADHIPASIEHPHRCWEASMALAAIDELASGNGGTLLDVGSGGSLFAPLAASMGYTVTVCDPHERVTYAGPQGHMLGKDIAIVRQDFMSVDLGQFDYVVCLSVLEHVPDDAAFVDKLLATANRGLVLTVDYSPGGHRFSNDHLRTYSPGMLAAMADVEGWETMDDLEYLDHGEQVYAYSFACLALRKVN